MKTIVPSKQCFVIPMLMLLIMTSGISSQAQSGSQTSPELTFTNPTLYSGSAGQDNAVYRFPNVNSNLDALVKITKRSSSKVKLDNIDLTSTGYSKAFQPQVSYNNGSTNNAASWWIEFEFTFVNKNTTTPAVINTFKMTALDIDGDNESLCEWTSFYGLSSFTLESNSQLQVSTIMETVQNVLQPVGKTFTGITTQYNGIDTATTSVMTTVQYDNAYSFRYRAGATTTDDADNTGRMYSTWFKSFNYNNPVTLPVKLTTFTAVLNQNKADLKWATASELNLSHFIIEKSYDGKNFNDAALVFAYGNTTEKTNYNFSDNINNTPQGIIYYRLRSVDNDQKIQLSEVRIIRITKQNELLKMVAYPNPVGNELRVTVPVSWQGKAVVFEVFNQNGQRVKILNTGGSSQTETLIVNDLAKSIYLLKASCGSETAQQKFVKK